MTDRRDTRQATARFDSYGQLAIRGVDRGPLVERVWGSSEYEWSRTVELRHVRLLRAALGCTTDSEMIEKIESMSIDEILAVISASDIPTTFFNWNSFD